MTGRTLREAIAEQVDVPNSILHTNEVGWYAALGRDFAEHAKVHHSRGEYVRDGTTTDHAEGYFAQLKRSIDGTHRNVSREHLDRYLAEYDFRFSTKKASDAERMAKIIAGAESRRLTYRPLADREM